MLLFVGLGNPGAKYARNRHNIGFMAVDAIAHAYRFGPWKKKVQSEIAEGQIDGARVLLMKPQTFMNESGRAVGEAAKFYKLAAPDVVAFYDEIDLAPGRFRMKTGGGAAGHNGIRSIMASNVGEGFRRARLGVGHDGVEPGPRVDGATREGRPAIGVLQVLDGHLLEGHGRAVQDVDVSDLFVVVVVVLVVVALGVAAARGEGEGEHRQREDSPAGRVPS